MPSDFKQELAAALALGEPEPLTPERELLRRPGRPTDRYNKLSITKTFARFKAEFLPLCPLLDPLDRHVCVFDLSFRKLLNLKHKKLGDNQRAYMVIEELERRTFNPTHYEAVPEDRIETLFWVPDTVTNPDAIFQNSHLTIKADEVYVTVYNKPGSRVKLTFTSTFGARINPRVEIVTSYLTNEARALRCLKGKPLYVRHQQK